VPEPAQRALPPLSGIREQRFLTAASPSLPDRLNAATRQATGRRVAQIVETAQAA